MSSYVCIDVAGPVYEFFSAITKVSTVSRGFRHHYSTYRSLKEIARLDMSLC